MKIRTERLKEMAGEVDALVKGYFASEIAQQKMAPLNFKWQAYKALEADSACKLFTAREDNKLIGCVLYIVQPHLHHDQVVAQCTIFGVQAEHRNNGIGRALVEYAERHFKKAGVTHIVHHHGTLYNVTPLFERMGFKLDELAYVKEL